MSIKNKINEDCLYVNLFNKIKDLNNKDEILKNSGFINEFRTYEDTAALTDMRLMTVPILEKKESNNPIAIIVSTGSFSPIHDGHIKMMELAKEHVDRLGYNVLQGIFSLSHDGYVDIKNNGIAKLNVSIRTDLIYNKIINHDWLTVDRFEGECVSIPLNFSTVIERIKRYFEYYLKKEITLFYVFGSDNKEFCNAFIDNKNYHAICIERNGYDYEDIKKTYKKEKNIHFLENKTIESTLSSTEVRKEKNLINKDNENKRKIYFIRTDSVPKSFALSLLDILKGNINEDVEFRFFSTKDLKYNQKEKIISLDKYFNTKHKLDVSRLFYLSSNQKKALKMIGYNESIDLQIKKISPGNYILLDDDTSTGFTVKNIKEKLLKHNIVITDYYFLINQMLKEKEIVYDIIDARDFFLGSYKSGLVSLFNKKMIRAPYVFPYVNLTTRANVLPEKQRLVSKRILIENLKYNQDLSSFVSFLNFKENKEFIDWLLTYINNGLL